MPVHPWLADKFELIRGIPSFAAAATDPGYGARLLDYLQDPQPWSPPADVVSEIATAGGVRLRVFRPAAPTGALLWMHGGGFVMGSVDDTESTVPGYELASRAGVTVASVDYRLAVGGVRYPAPLEDVLEAWRWLATLGFPDRRLFLGGASVGAGLAVSASVRLRDANAPMPRGLLLAYPILHFPVPAPSPHLERELDELPSMLRFPAQFQAGVVQNYAGRLDDLPADAVPGNHAVDGLPEAFLAPAEYDDLRPSGERFAEQLEEAGVAAHVHLARGMVHGYLGRTPTLEPVSEVLDFFADALRGASSDTFSNTDTAR
jgi:acetyl esterase